MADHWIGGRRVTSPVRFDDISPIDGSVLAHVSRACPYEVDLAVDTAGQAFTHWRRTTREQRAEYLHKIADGVEKRIDELAAVEPRTTERCCVRTCAA